MFDPPASSCTSMASSKFSPPSFSHPPRIRKRSWRPRVEVCRPRFRASSTSSLEEWYATTLPRHLLSDTYERSRWLAPCSRCVYIPVVESPAQFTQYLTCGILLCYGSSLPRSVKSSSLRSFSAWYYYSLFPTDPWFFKALVVLCLSLCIAETTVSGMCLRLIFEYLKN